MTLLRATLNGLTPRTVRDTSRDPFDWIDPRLSHRLYPHPRMEKRTMRPLPADPAPLDADEAALEAEFEAATLEARDAELDGFEAIEADCKAWCRRVAQRAASWALAIGGAAIVIGVAWWSRVS
jgi:hypothetical protein